MNNIFYISTSIPYANGEPHIWFAMECIIADSIARTMRMLWKDVFFATWLDEHGINIYRTALSKGISPKDLVDWLSLKYRSLKSSLNLSYNDFIRTSDKERHFPSAQDIWTRLEKSGDIYKKAYTWLYCEWCEAFLDDKDLVDSLCPNHRKPPVQIQEENYFFRLSKYSDKVLDLLKSDKIRIVPSFRKNEILTMIEDQWLKDVSFSRPSANLPWGIPVPWDPSQNMYVWSDALTNYLSILGSLRENYWDNWFKVHCIGKDIVRFHAWIWIWMLLSAKIAVPDVIHIHGFLTSNGHKISKSLWNVIDPVEIVDKYWIDALRYFLLREVPTWRDADFTASHFISIYNAHLANWLWNLVNRILVMSIKNWINPKEQRSNEFEPTISRVKNEFNNLAPTLDTYLLILKVFELVEFGNKQMDELKPWLINKENPDKFFLVMLEFLHLLKAISELLYPFLPNASAKIKTMLWIQDSNWTSLWKSEILFARIEDQ